MVVISDAALSIICLYPLVKRRMDMGFLEYINYTDNWNIFNRVWAYNYTVRELRTAGGNEGYYQFVTDSERISYVNGRTSHIAAYPAAAATGAFNNIP